MIESLVLYRGIRLLKLLDVYSLLNHYIDYNSTNIQFFLNFIVYTGNIVNIIISFNL